MIPEYLLSEIEVDMENRELKIPKNSKIIDIIYYVRAGDITYGIGSYDRLMIFNEISRASIMGDGPEKLQDLKLRYGMTVLPDYCFQHTPFIVIRALIPIIKKGE